MSSEHVDVLIVGAGVSGIGCAYHLQTEAPTKSYMILEARETTGGTWDLFTYPGIRSDSDLHTFGYAFKPWRHDKAIADGPAILDYIRETASENGIEQHIRTGHRVAGARWSSADARWTADVQRADGTATTITCDWLFVAGGYYRYDQGFMPDFPGLADFQGTIIHPQHWPEDLDYAGKDVVVIGSGATAMTIVPAMANEGAGSVTMLQRSPTYVASVPQRDPIANWLKTKMSEKRAYALTRRKNIWQQKTVFSLSQKHPKLVRRLLTAGVKRQLPEGYDVATHFNPTYDPWDQRLCAVPDGDLFKAISKGDATIVTDKVKRFVAGGIELESGRTLPADIIISATGLNLLAFGGVQLTVDDTPVALNEHLVYKGMMLSDVPNFAFAIGYTNSSWTLKVDLVCEHLTRMLGYMDRFGHAIATPHALEPGMETRPLLDFAAGYVQRSLQDFPRQGVRAPWSMAMSYATDIKALREGPVNDPELRFSAAGAPARSGGDAEPERAVAA
jgi:cation diffusion facilitator CzcD-associated flavoprotein CzcO